MKISHFRIICAANGTVEIKYLSFFLAQLFFHRIQMLWAETGIININIINFWLFFVYCDVAGDNSEGKTEITFRVKLQ